MRLAIGLLLLSTPICSDGDRGPATCADAACDPGAEYCVVHGSDVAGEPDVAACEPLPSTCVEPLSCDCLDGAAADFGLDFCLQEGGCAVVDGSLEVTCPGG